MLIRNIVFKDVSLSEAISMTKILISIYLPFDMAACYLFYNTVLDWPNAECPTSGGSAPLDMILLVLPENISLKHGECAAHAIHQSFGDI